jgi:sulfite reductase (ferredoxin)
MNTKAKQKTTPELNTCLPASTQRGEPTANRLLGVYPQKQDGLFMQRIKVFGGRINWPQWRRVAELAAKYSKNFPLHITTRQDIELHNVALESIASIHQGLAEVALIIFGAGGDSIRNITVCSACDFCKGGFDLLPVAALVREYLEQQPVVLNLPRKFKISFSGCEKACAKPWLNDLGFIAQADGLLTVIGAGSLGNKPALGVELYKDFPVKDILPLCIAAVELFEKYGDRENRHHARLRHVRERLGDQAFRIELDTWFGLVKARQSWPDLVLAQNNNAGIKLLYLLQLPNGNINSHDAIQLADVSEPKGVQIRINLEHGLELYGTEKFPLPDNLAILTKNPTIIACPGSATCPKGLVDTWATAERIRQTFATKNISDVRINISGCPNNCGQSTVADVGLVGLLRKENGNKVPYYRIYVGGSNGKNNILAQQHCIVSAGDAPCIIKDLLKLIKQSLNDGTDTNDIRSKNNM